MYKGDVLDKIMAFEQGEMSSDEVLAFFAELIKTGLAWKLQGMYGRLAKQMIDDGWISKDGEILEIEDGFRVVKNSKFPY